MIFPYWEVGLNGEVHWFPLLPVTLHGVGTTVDVVALVDSGAEFSVLGTDLASRLELSLAESTPVTLVGIGEHEVTGQLVPMEFQLGKHRWTAPTVFSSAADKRAIFGQTGFFAFFTVCFRYGKREIDVRRAR